MIDFPSPWEAPCRLYDLEGNCGVLVAWSVLRYFHKRTSSAHIIQACRYTKKHGVFAISLAVTLKQRGLSVTFYSDPDPTPNRIERLDYHRAQQLGIAIKSAIELEQVLAQITPQTIPIVLYKTDEGDGHFSPIVNFAEGFVHLPYAETNEHQSMTTQELLRRWTAPKILRQCIIASGTRLKEAGRER